MIDYAEKLEKFKEIPLDEAMKLYAEGQYWKELLEKHYNITDKDPGECYYKPGDPIVIYGVEGYVVKTYDNGAHSPFSGIPQWVMSKECVEDITWDDAMKLQLPDDWIIPTHEDQVDFIDYVKLLFNKGIPNFDLSRLDVDTCKFLWSSSIQVNLSKTDGPDEGYDYDAWGILIDRKNNWINPFAHSPVDAKRTARWFRELRRI